MKIKKLLLATLLPTLFLLSGCGDDASPQETSPLVTYCQNEGGSVVTSSSTGEKLCQYTKTYDYDDGEESYTFSCNLTSFYEEDGECRDLESESYDSPLISSLEPTVGETFHRSAVDILSKLNNTGYTHKTNGPFILQPNPQELVHTNELKQIEFNATIEAYNLFLDCSGFVGYYVLQGISKQLYEEVNTCYHSSRPLAADFADTFRDAKHTTSDENVTDALLSELNYTQNDVEWGRVPHIKDAKAGDIIVYKHSKNITNNGECDNTVHGNTGHVLFIMSKPQKSTHYGNEWLVKVADSTTAPHSHDSRKICNKEVYEQSNYQAHDEVPNNPYTAWSKRYDCDFLELCDSDTNDTFHRRCADYGFNSLQKIEPQTNKIASPTGIGKGSIYISENMKHYRVKYGASLKDADVYIGRPILHKEIFTFKGDEYATVVSPETNRTWLDRNLGASQACTSLLDSQCAGDFYQWGREADGHQESNSSIQTQQATTLKNVGSDFLAVSFIPGNTDWTSLDENGSLRSDFWSDAQSGAICPVGFRVPSMSELLAEFQKVVDNRYVEVSTPQDSFLHLSVAAGYRNFSDGIFQDTNQSSHLWSYTSARDRQASSLGIDYYKEDGYNSAWETGGRPGYGYNIRCIKELE